MYRVFISSVQREFSKERKAIAAAIRKDRVLKLFFDPFLFEKSGSGTGDIINKCRAWGLPDPEYCPDNVDFKTIIWRNEKVTPVKNLTPVRGGKAKKTRVDAL